MTSMHDYKHALSPSCRPGLIRRRWALFALCLALSIFALGHSAFATDCTDCSCPEAAQTITRAYIGQQHQETEDFFGTAEPLPDGADPGGTLGSGLLGKDEEWMNTTIFTDNLAPALQMMSEQLVTAMMNQMLSIGAILDAKGQLETQLLFQKLEAEAHKDYQPSLGMCTYGTSIRSLATADRKARSAAHVLEKHFIDRQMGNGDVSGAESEQGAFGDRNDRLANFVENFCDYDDNDRLDNVPDTGLAMVCNATANTTLPANQAGPVGTFGPRNNLSDLNEDVDFTRVVQDPDTIPVDMSNPDQAQLNPIFAMQNNLYGSDATTRISYQQLKQETSLPEVVDVRSLAAKRSVAESSFDTIVGMKSMGSPAGSGTGMGSADTLNDYFSVIMTDLGVPKAEMTELLGSQPSYYAQLKFLAKRLYQRPEFYQDLYDTPANVERKKVAMQAINSILEREIYKSRMRSEAIMSQILELHVGQRQDAVQDEIKNPGLRRE